jgi:hypothetical protein
MYEFFIGVGLGALGSMMTRARARGREVGTQVDSWPASPPVMVPVKRKAFVPGELVNFWGKDS